LELSDRFRAIGVEIEDACDSYISATLRAGIFGPHIDGAIVVNAVKTRTLQNLAPALPVSFRFELILYSRTQLVNPSHHLCPQSSHADGPLHYTGALMEVAMTGDILEHSLTAAALLVSVLSLGMPFPVPCC